MYKQYKLIELLEDGTKVHYTFETKKQLKAFISVLDSFNFSVKEEYVGVSI